MQTGADAARLRVKLAPRARKPQKLLPRSLKNSKPNEASPSKNTTNTMPGDQDVRAIKQQELAQISNYLVSGQLSLAQPCTFFGQVDPSWNQLPYEYQKMQADKIRDWFIVNHINLGFLSIHNAIVAQI